MSAQEATYVAPDGSIKKLSHVNINQFYPEVELRNPKDKDEVKLGEFVGSGSWIAAEEKDANNSNIATIQENSSEDATNKSSSDLQIAKADEQEDKECDERNEQKEEHADIKSEDAERPPNGSTEVLDKGENSEENPLSEEHEDKEKSQDESLQGVSSENEMKSKDSDKKNEEGSVVLDNDTPNGTPEQTEKEQDADNSEGIEKSKSESQSVQEGSFKEEQFSIESQSTENIQTESFEEKKIDTDQKALPSAGEAAGVFSTQVDEDTLEAARARGGGGGVFEPERWEATPETTTMSELMNAKVQKHWELGEQLHEEEDYHGAITHYNKVLSLRPREVYVFVRRAEAFLHLSDFQSAILNYKRACVLEPRNFEYYDRLAFIYYFQGQCLHDQRLFPEALESFSRAAEMRPEIIGYHTRSIACLAALQRHGECLALVNKRLESEHDNADLYVMRARLHQLFRNTTLCYYDVKDALALDPKHHEALTLLQQLEHRAEEMRRAATQLYLTARYRDAMQKISIAIETNPSIADFHVLRGALYRKLGDFNASIDDYLLALDKTDHDEEHAVYREAQRQLLLTYNDFAIECFNKAYYEEAIILLNKAIKGEKAERGLYVNRGDCFYKLGELQFALADYHQALEMRGGGADDASIKARIAVVHNEYGLQEYADKKYQEAESRFTLAIQNNPKVAEYYISRARMRNIMEDQPMAREDLLLALHLDPSHPEAMGILAHLFPGKSARDVLASPAAARARSALHHLVATAAPVRLRPLPPTAVPVDVTKSTATENVSGGSHRSSSRGSSVSDGGDSDAASSTSQLLANQEDTSPATALGGDVEAGVSVWRPGGAIPTLKECMVEQDFLIGVAREKAYVNQRVKDALRLRPGLGSPIGHIGPMPEPPPKPRKGRKKGGGGAGGPQQGKPAVKATPSTGWRKFTAGIGVGH